MKTKQKLFVIPAAILVALALFGVSFAAFLHFADWGFPRTVPFSEQLLRLHTVHTAQSWLGTTEHSETHEEILNIYNAHTPLARGYAVTVDDNWCATFGSCIAIQRRLTEIIPTECGCERQIELWKMIDQWEEDDNYLPLPGDYIYYNWDAVPVPEDNSGWSDHVGIVVGTAGPFIKVIEGNRNDSVTYRIILRGNYQIRGFGLPDYASKLP